MIRFTRTGGIEPADNEELVVGDDGLARSERSVAGGRIGRFERMIEPEALVALEDHARAAAAEGPHGLRTRPDGAVESVEANGVIGRFDPYRTPDGAWGPLVTTLRALLEDGNAAPRSGLALRVAPDARSATLERLGTGEVSVAPGSVAIEARIVRDGMVARSWAVPAPDVPSTVPVSWSVTLELSPPEAPAGGYVEVAVDLVAGFDGPALPRRVIAAT